MNIILVLLPVALLLGFGFLGAFLYGVYQGQFDDLETPRHRILLPDPNDGEK
jgi:cbb3-type cytochrome oxidase maturation protein